MCSRVGHLPAPGETVGDGVFMQAYGGKGANQAVAAARLGGDVSFITALGGDSLGDELAANFRKENIDTTALYRLDGVSTGIALIMVDATGENCIAVNPGANAMLTPAMLDAHKKVIEEAGIIVMQAEIPYETVKHAARMAKAAGVAVLYNPAPVCAVDDEMMRMTDVLVVNETEGATLSGECGYEAMAEALHRRGAATVVVTLGSKGAYCSDGTVGFFVPSFKVKAVDAVGAGDTFCGALAVAYCRNGRVDAGGLTFATAAAAISVTKSGAQPSIPTYEETILFLADRK